MPPVGFAVAMQGRLRFIGLRGRHPASVRVTLIVSQFRRDGLVLAVSLAALNAQPPVLRPRLTVLARRVSGTDHGPSQRFRLLDAAQPALHLAGRWRGARGIACLDGQVPALRIAVIGRLVQGPCWRLCAAQIPWIGEWVAADHARLTLG